MESEKRHSSDGEKHEYSKVVNNLVDILRDIALSNFA